MITIQKLQIYSQFNGDIDGFARLADEQQKMLINSGEWSVIESLLQDIGLVEKGLVSEHYRKEFENKLKTICENEETARVLRSLSI